MFYVYALKSVQHDRIYIGLTSNICRRFKEHNLGKTRSTKFYKPWILIYSEKLDTRAAARRQEKKLKTGSGREFLRMLITAPVAHKDRAAVS